MRSLTQKLKYGLPVCITKGNDKLAFMQIIIYNNLFYPIG